MAPELDCGASLVGLDPVVLDPGVGLNQMCERDLHVLGRQPLEQEGARLVEGLHVLGYARMQVLLSLMQLLSLLKPLFLYTTHD